MAAARSLSRRRRGLDDRCRQGGVRPRVALTRGRVYDRRSLMARLVALDHGAARCGCAVSDPTGTLVTPLAAVAHPDTRRGLAAVVRLIEGQGAEGVVVGLPLTLAGEEGEQAARARAFAEQLRRRLRVPVELHDERLTTRLAERTGGTADADSRAAAHLLESYLARLPAGTPE